MPSAKIIIGAGLWGDQVSTEEVSNLAHVLKELGIKEIDSAAEYPIGKAGLTDKIIGDFGFAKSGFHIDSKSLWSGNGKGTLKAPAVQKALNQTLASAQIPKVHILYCHGPDTETPIAAQAAAMNAQYRLGSFEKLGVCNFQPNMLEEWLRIDDEKGYIKPSVYQGQYNLRRREYETLIFPILRQHDMSFVGFSPLAGGYLTGLTHFRG
ncbi:NADP-dependent oxidoreductase domain-containing protein [Clohesyomyces aquaticus]|uniref:NADP-dependent oxidoreductase domain-containing protein n=1 Tax=Clohesyomyces aquaticus TaxID=1231657 RepID=A0A1Y1YLR9_9PLEO|nr:NADP-dependent oxidoreductase domain-containing protein [Clohesyomyces aquaticus]